MSQETSSPTGSLVGMISQILALQAMRASFSAFSSCVSSAGFSGAAAAGFASSAAERQERRNGSTNANRVPHQSSSSRAVERLDDGLSHPARTDSAAAVLRDVGGAQALVEHRGDGALDAVGDVAKIEGIAQAHGEA